MSPLNKYLVIGGLSSFIIGFLFVGMTWEYADLLNDKIPPIVYTIEMYTLGLPLFPSFEITNALGCQSSSCVIPALWMSYPIYGITGMIIGFIIFRFRKSKQTQSSTIWKHLFVGEIYLFSTILLQSIVTILSWTERMPEMYAGKILSIASWSGFITEPLCHNNSSFICNSFIDFSITSGIYVVTGVFLSWLVSKILSKFKKKEKR